MNKQKMLLSSILIVATGLLTINPPLIGSVNAQPYEDEYDKGYDNGYRYQDEYDKGYDNGYRYQDEYDKGYDNGYLDKNSKPKIFPANKVSQLGDRWWQWGVDPFTNLGQVECDDGLQDNGKLLFLVGTAKDPETGFPVHECDIKKGTSILFPIVTVACSDLKAPPFFGANEQEQRQCANSFIDTAVVEEFVVKIDGHSVKNLEQYRIDSPAGGFEFTAVENNPFATPVGDGTGVSDGYWILLAPLKPGKHTIEFIGVLDLTEIFGEPFIFEGGATYNLNVKSGYY